MNSEAVLRFPPALNGSNDETCGGLGESVEVAKLCTEPETLPSQRPSTAFELISDTANPSDEVLLDRMCAADRDALGLLFRRYATMVRVVGQRILRDPAEAEDLVQEVFLFVFRKAALFDPERGSGHSWLLQVTYHRAFDRRRYLASRRFYSNLELQEGILESQEPAALTLSYENTLEAALGREALRRIDEVLSDVQRKVLYLHFFEGYTVQEIASLLGQSVGNVRNHYYRALEKMRRELFNAPLQGK